MQFGFTEQQVAFRDAVRDVLGDLCRPAQVRQAWEGGPGWDATLWAALAQMGVLGVMAPEKCGGSALTEVELVLILEETGRAAMPGPIVEHVAVGVPLLADAGQTELAADAGAGRYVVTFADRSERVGWGREADGVLIATGTGLQLVSADDVVVTGSLDCADRSRRDVSMQWSVALDLAADEQLAIDRATLGAAAQLCGLAHHLIETTSAYVRERRQFGVPVGSYQAVKHHLANALLRVEHARPAVYRAAWSTATAASTRRRDVAMAKALANEAAAFAGRVALQCHGAIGYTWEHDLHLWLKRVWVLERAWGDTARHRETVADAVITTT